jgi:hypothetical protein
MTSQKTVIFEELDFPSDLEKAITGEHLVKEKELSYSNYFLPFPPPPCHILLFHQLIVTFFLFTLFAFILLLLFLILFLPLLIIFLSPFSLQGWPVP